VAAELPRDVGAHWYEVVAAGDDSIRQGDIFRNLTAAWLPDDLPKPEAGKEKEVRVDVQFEPGDWIVLSASCDVQPGRGGGSQQQVLIARVYPCTPDHLPNVKSEKDLRERIEVFLRGLDPQRYLLAQHTAQPQLPLSFAVFRLQVTMPLRYLQRSTKEPRLRLKPPHRENFGNWAGTCLSRVGIEDGQQIRFEKPAGLYPAQVLRSVTDD
jgi:hypothetical protein